MGSLFDLWIFAFRFADVALGARPCGLRAARLNPPPPEGSERVQTVFEIVFEFFEIKELSQAPRIPPADRKNPGPRPQIRSKIGLKIDQNFDAILVSFLASFCFPFGILFRSFSLPDRSWRPLGFKNVNFHEIVEKTIENQ